MDARVNDFDPKERARWDDGARARFGSPQKKLLIGGGVVALALAVIVAFRTLAPKPPAPAEVAPLVSIVVPQLSEVAQRVTFSGTIGARYDMPIGVEGEGGRVAAVLVEPGDKVRRGQVLARLDTATLAPQTASLAAALDQAQAEAELAAADYARAQGVAASGALSKEEIERRRSAQVTAAARVKVAAAQLAEARARLGRAEVRAPADGIVLTRSAEVGQVAGAGGEALFRLARSGEVEMRGQVAEQDLPQLRVGQTVAVRLTGIDKPFDGRIRLLGAIIDPQTRLGDIRVELAADPNLRPGAFARAEAVIDRAERAVVPQTAVLNDTEGSYVFVVGEGDKVVRKTIRVGGTVPGGVIVASGLAGSERVVSTAGAFLREGEKVRVTSTSAQAAASPGNGAG